MGRQGAVRSGKGAGVLMLGSGRDEGELETVGAQ